MPISQFEHIKRFFSRIGDEEENQALFKEMLLMTLARATRADAVDRREGDCDGPAHREGIHPEKR